MNTVFLEKICRCCLNESDDMTTNLSDRTQGFGPFIFDDNFTYSDLIYLCTNVRCDLDVVDSNDHIIELPRNVCENCLHELRAAFLFRQKCESSEQLLREQTLIGISNDSKEVIEIEHTILQTGNVTKSDVSAGKECDPSEERIIITDHSPVLIAIDNINKTDDTTNAIEVQFVPTASNDNDQQRNATKNHIIKSPDFTSYDTMHPGEERNDVDRFRGKKYKCEECPKEFLTERRFLSHKAIHSGATTKRKLLCSICGKLFATKQRLIMHSALHSKEKKHQCDECDKKFSTVARLRLHQRTHTGEKPFRCDFDQCGLTFAQGNALRCHKRIHTGEKPYECQVCKKRFTQNTILKTHMTLHTGKTVKCPDCGKLFSRASNLILHRRDHTGDRPYRCEHCPNRYKQKSHLDQHVNTHLGVKHICEICQKCYSKRWSLKCHMLTHSKVNPHSCTLCDAKYPRRDKLKIHLKSAHGLTDTAIENLDTTKLNATK